MKRVLTAQEMDLIRRLCRPEKDAFEATTDDMAPLDIFQREGIVKIDKDGAFEVTNYGANCYIETFNKRRIPQGN